MDNLQIKSSFVNKNLYALSRILVTVGCLSLVINDAGGNPLPDLLWECNNGSSTKRSNESTVTSSVSWVAKQGQNKKCFCRSLHSESNQSVEVNLDVLFPPKVPNVSTDSVNVESTINKIINTSLVIHCNSTGNPEPNFIWLLPDKSISKGDALIINHIDMSNKGTYYCKAENMLNPSNGNVEIGRSEVSIDVHLLKIQNFKV
ncbi:contactin-6-like [Ruditapes philippinarum]|uniref:contactin-6-like n=1 Tax=Ruditapes philippinarum TaxID=129788 RepID=UPI00295C21AC|nr:contactin-6-like [Ruditapes philippinarum]